MRADYKWRYYSSVSGFPITAPRFLMIRGYLTNIHKLGPNQSGLVMFKSGHNLLERYVNYFTFMDIHRNRFGRRAR